VVKTATKPELTRDLKLSDRSFSGRLSVISHPSSPKFQNASLFSVSLAACTYQSAVAHSPAGEATADQSDNPEILRSSTVTMSTKKRMGVFRLQELGGTWLSSEAAMFDS
jgi:hypothetical protein